MDARDETYDCFMTPVVMVRETDYWQECVF